MMVFPLFATAICVLAAADTDRLDSDRPPPGKPEFKVTSRHPDDRVAVKSSADAVVFDIDSPFGISRAKIERLSGAWPKVVEVRLRLKALSNFGVTDGKTTVDGSLLVNNGHVVERVWKDGKEENVLHAKHPLYLQMQAPQGSASDFRIILPSALLTSDVREITVRWIDLYR